MENNFDMEQYFSLLKQDFSRRSASCQGKLYVELNGKLLKDDFASRIFSGYDSYAKKKMLISIKNDLELLVCINARHIIDNLPMTKEQISYIEYTERTLKRIETAIGVRPQLVITNINMEEMYDLVFSFENRFQKKGYKVWERYKIRGYPFNKDHLLGEEGFGADDHIPLMKKIVFVTGIGIESGKLATCIGQIYQDHLIGIPSSFCMFQTLPLAELSIENPINQAWSRKRENESLVQDDFGETVEDSSRESFSIIRSLLDGCIEKDNLIHSYKKVGDMIICPTFSCVKDIAQAEALAQKEL